MDYIPSPGTMCYTTDHYDRLLLVVPTTAGPVVSYLQCSAPAAVGESEDRANLLY